MREVTRLIVSLLTALWCSLALITAPVHADEESQKQADAQRALERGREMQARVYSDMEADDPWLRMGQTHLFGQIWTRPGLTIKERRLISLSIAASVGSRLGFAAHLRGALESGDLSEAELWEWLIHFTQYAGYPKAAPVWSEYRILLAERGSMPLPAMGVDRGRAPGDPTEDPATPATD